MNVDRTAVAYLCRLGADDLDWLSTVTRAELCWRPGFSRRWYSSAIARSAAWTSCRVPGRTAKSASMPPDGVGPMVRAALSPTRSNNLGVRKPRANSAISRHGSFVSQWRPNRKHIQAGSSAEPPQLSIISKSGNSLSADTSPATPRSTGTLTLASPDVELVRSLGAPAVKENGRRAEALAAALRVLDRLRVCAPLTGRRDGTGSATE
jgi:hypothetical protein